MSALKNKLISILPNSTNTETSLSKMDRVFMIILLLHLGLDFENIDEFKNHLFLSLFFMYI